MRDVSIPPWATLRESSSSSAAPSEDELQGQSSQHRMSTSRRRPSPPLTQNAVGPSTSGWGSGRGNGGGSSYGSRAHNSANRPSGQPSSGRARRQRSESSEEDEEVRPSQKKKQKKRKIDLSGSNALANTKVPDPGRTPRHSLPSSNRPPIPKFNVAPAGGRRKTLDIGAHDREDPRPGKTHVTNDDIRKPRKCTFPQIPRGRPTTQSGGATSSVQTTGKSDKRSAMSARRGQTGNVGRSNDSPSSRSASQSSARGRRQSQAAIDVIEIEDDSSPPPERSTSRRASAPAAPHEVIEISDNDDEPPPPPPPQIPRGSGKRKPAVNYKEVGNIIFLDESDDEVTPSGGPSRPTSGNVTTNAARPPVVTAPSPSPAPIRSHGHVTPVDERSSPAPDLQQSPTSPTSSQSIGRISISREASLEPDVEMLDADPSGTQLGMGSDASMDDDDDPLLETSVAVEETSAPVVEDGLASELMPSSLLDSPLADFAIAEEAVDRAVTLLPGQLLQAEEPISRDDITILDSASSPFREASPSPAHIVIPPDPFTVNRDSSVSSVRASPPVAFYHSPDTLRAETASPVSSVLDPRLQDLSITLPSGRVVHQPMSPRSPMAPPRATPPVSPPSAAVRSPKLSTTSRTRPRPRLQGTLYGQADGFFGSVLRLSQKRRLSTQSRAHSNAMSPSSMHSSPTRSPAVARAESSATLSTAAVEPPETPMEEVVSQSQEMSTTITHINEMQEIARDTAAPLLPFHDSEMMPALSPEAASIQGQTLGSSTTGEADSAKQDKPNTPRNETPSVQNAFATVRENRSANTNVQDKSAARQNPIACEAPNILEEPIDLTNDGDEDVPPPSPSVKPNNATTPVTTEVQSSSPRPPTVASVGTPQPISNPIPHLSFSVRKRARLIRPNQQSPIKGKGTIPPIPRHLHMASKDQITLPLPLSGQSSAPASTAPGIASSSHIIEPGASISAPVTPAPPSQRFKLLPPSQPPVIPPRPSTAATSTSVLENSQASPSVETTDGGFDTSEEEGNRELAYPNSTHENTPDVEMVDDEHPARAFVGRRKRGEDASEASSSSGPRRSARLSSSSASSSVEPPDDIEEPRRRLRRREPYIHNPSEEDVAAYGGISRSRYNKYLQAFESAGFGSLSWRKDKRRIAKEHAPVTQLAENIPHDLHDRLNALNSSARRAGNMQVLIFEAEMLANTAEDEPDAPPIRIVNEVDDEPTPPLEFYYSNLMWHGKGVPKPDYDALQGCGCVGPCDPMSKTCSCLKRQKRFLEQENNSQVGFIYDKKGRLKANEYPIFECNMNCGCSDDCMNRVIQHGRQHEIMIQKTVNKGWGVFAGPKKIPANTYIGIYAGEYLLDAEGEHRGKMYNKFGRTYLFDIDFYYLRKEDDQIKYTIDAYHAGNFTRYLNHSCDPNCTIVAAYINEANLDKPLLSIFTKRDVEPYEEICFSYFGDGDDNDLPQDGSDDDASPVYDGAVYVKCQCGAENCRGNMWK